MSEGIVDTPNNVSQFDRPWPSARAPAPEVLDEVTLEGRFGIVLPRLDEPTLLQLSRTGAMTSEQVGSIPWRRKVSCRRTGPLRRRTPLRADDPLQVDLQRPFVECLAECFVALPDLRANRITDAVSRRPSGSLELPLELGDPLKGAGFVLVTAWRSRGAGSLVASKICKKTRTRDDITI